MDDAALDALGEALDAVGDRWTLLVIAALLDGPARYGDLQEALPSIAPNVLAGRLRALEGRGLVVARPYSKRPPRSVYDLSEAARELTGALRLLAGWGARQSGGVDAPRHDACGTTLEARLWCPACETTVDAGEAGDVHLA